MLGVQRRRAPANHQPRSFKLGGHVGQAELQGLEFTQGLAELMAGVQVALGAVQGQARPAQRAGGDVQPPAVQAHHGEAETVALVADPVLDRHAAIVEIDDGGGLAAPAHLLLVRPEAEARRPLLHHHGRDAPGPGLAGADHDHIDVRDPGAGNEGLGAVQHIVVALALGRGAQRGGVRTRAWLSQAVGGDQLHGRKARQVFPAQLVGTELVDHPRGHVVDRQEGGGGDVAIGQGFKDQGRVQPPQARPADILAHIDAGEAQLGRLAQGLDRKVLLLVPAGRVGGEFGGGELPRRILDRALVLVQVKAHATSVSAMDAAMTTYRSSPQRRPIPYFIVGMTKAESSLMPSGQRAVTVLTLV